MENPSKLFRFEKKEPRQHNPSPQNEKKSTQQPVAHSSIKNTSLPVGHSSASQHPQVESFASLEDYHVLREYLFKITEADKFAELIAKFHRQAREHHLKNYLQGRYDLKNFLTNVLQDPLTILRPEQLPKDSSLQAEHPFFVLVDQIMQQLQVLKRALLHIEHNAQAYPDQQAFQQSPSYQKASRKYKSVLETLDFIAQNKFLNIEKKNTASPSIQELISSVRLQSSTSTTSQQEQQQSQWQWLQSSPGLFTKKSAQSMDADNNSDEPFDVFGEKFH